VPVHYSCAPPSPGQVLVVIDENGVEGINGVPATCDGQNHSVTVPVDGLFTPGTATGQAVVGNADGSSEAVDYGSNVAIK
jgi:hypothetical protein